MAIEQRGVQNLNNSAAPSWPTINNSSSVESSNLIERNIQNLCVPVDPIGWVYGNNCIALKVPNGNNPVRFSVLPDSEFNFQIPTGLKGTELLALSIAAAPENGRSSEISMLLTIKLTDGTQLLFSGSKFVQPDGGGIELSG